MTDVDTITMKVTFEQLADLLDAEVIHGTGYFKPNLERPVLPLKLGEHNLGTWTVGEIETIWRNDPPWESAIRTFQVTLRRVSR